MDLPVDELLLDEQSTEATSWKDIPEDLQRTIIQ